MSRLAPLLHPELRALPLEARGQALREARRTPFDSLELLGMAAALIAAAMFLTYGLGSIVPHAGLLTTILVGALVFAATVGPFLIRRTRRGLAFFLAGR